VGGVHVVEFALEFKSQLDFFLVVLRILVVVFLQLEAQLFFVHPLAIKLLAVLLEGVLVFFADQLVLGLIIEFLLVLLL
jgi:hypothetical protein